MTIHRFVGHGAVLLVALLASNLVTTTSAFHVGRSCVTTTPPPPTRVRRSTSTLLRAEVVDTPDLLLVKSTLAENFPSFNFILQKNDAVWKALAGAEGGGFTIFVLGQEAMGAMGEGKLKQLMDPRNLEQTEKIGAYHVISETVTAEQLFNSGGVITLGGEVLIERSRSGGMFGVGGKEDGSVTLNGAKVLRSVPLGSGIVHEVDSLISPKIIWRYMDQLRIPGSS